MRSRSASSKNLPTLHIKHQICSIIALMSELSLKELQYFVGLSLDALDGYCTHKAARASGPGGQGVNTTDSKVLTRFNPDATIRATSQRERSQYLNRKANLQKIHNKLVALATPTPKRVATRPSKSAHARRLDAKIKRGAIKKSRGKNYDDGWV
jgi:protein subunit release factor B